MKPEIRQLRERQRQFEEMRRLQQQQAERQQRQFEEMRRLQQQQAEQQRQFDFDGDGISNAQEWAAGTNPYSIDTDGDGFTDLDELQDGSNPKQPCIDVDDQEVDREREIG